MEFYIKNGEKVFQCILKAIQMNYYLPKRTIHDNVSYKETNGGDSKHHVHGGESSQPDFLK